MNKLKALGTAAVISISALGGAMPATADHIERTLADYTDWKFVGFDDKDEIPLLYDIRHVVRKGSFVEAPTDINGMRSLFVVDCARRMYTISMDGDYSTPKTLISRNSMADALADELCY